MVAGWLNNMDLMQLKCVEMMHPKRSMRSVLSGHCDWPSTANVLVLKSCGLYLTLIMRSIQGMAGRCRSLPPSLRCWKNLCVIEAAARFICPRFPVCQYAVIWQWYNHYRFCWSANLIKYSARLGVYTKLRMLKNYFWQTNNRIVKPLRGVNKNIPAKPLPILV